MNVDTREIYCTQEAIDAAKARGENLVELSDGIVAQMVTIEAAQKQLWHYEAKKRFRASFLPGQQYKSPKY